MKLDTALNLAKNRFLLSTALAARPCTNCRQDIHAANPDNRATAKQAALIVVSMTGSPFHIGAGRGAR